MTPVSRGTAAGRAYLDLKAKAKKESRLTDELIQLYVLEGFLARLAMSAYADQLVLKGGVLLAAFDTRRPTRDIDFAARDLTNDTEHILGVTRAILASAQKDDDGLVFDPGSAVAEVIRDEEEYSGVRVSMNAELATARVRFHLDVNVGDPVWPAPSRVSMPRLLGGQPLELMGYPLHMVHAEKIVTAVQRGSVNTRWRDFGDVWTLAGKHSVSGDGLHSAIVEVAGYRQAALSPLHDLLQGYPAIAQPKWAAWRRKQRLIDLPEDFGVLLEDFCSFADPVIIGDPPGMTWIPADRVWR